MRRLPALFFSILLACLGLLVFWNTISKAASSASAAPDAPMPGITQQVPAGTQSEDRLRISPSLLKAMAAAPSGEQLPVIVEWRRSVSLSSKSAAPTRLEQREQVVAALQEDAWRRSSALQSALQEAASQGQASELRAFWASPVIAARVSPTTIETLSARDDVVQIRLDEMFHLEDTDFVKDAAAPPAALFPDNLRLVKVDLAQQALGLDGSGVVVASMDTGVDWQHPALMKKYRGYNPKGPAVHAGNWYVVTGEPYVYPGDGIGHGTHTMGTMVGDDQDGNRIGVAPGAKWIAVKMFNNQGNAYESWVHAAFQWILAPDGNPALAPDIVNNSWGSKDGTDERYLPDVNALLAAGIIPVFSAGNSGPDAGTIDSPASFSESLAVGAVDLDKQPAWFSSRGPSPWGAIKPEVAGPGVNVRSSFPGGGYAFSSGTSMAAPHISGLIALLLQAHPGLTPYQISNILKNTAEPLGNVRPNNTTGWGLANAYAAGLQVTEHGELVGKVVRPDGGPVANPAVTAALRDGSQAITVTGDAQGAFSIALRPGIYDVTGRAFGFDPNTVYAIQVQSGQQAQAQVVLTPQPVGSVFGRVLDVKSGAPLSATLTVEDTPISIQTNPDTGAYSLALPGGTWPIRIYASAHRTGHITPTVTGGNGYPFEIGLQPGPKILLVDSGRWYYQSQIHYYEDALDALDYPYTLWPIRNFQQPGLPDDRPTTSALSAYNVVIWSSPSDSPGMLGLSDVITSYLKSKGNLLISGQDVAFWDGGGTINGFLSDYFLYNLGIQFDQEGNLDDLHGSAGGPLQGSTVSLNTPDSARQQVSPDAVRITNPRRTSPAAAWPDQTIGGVVAGTCQPYQAAWLGFGLEGAGPRPARIDLLQRLLDWMQSPPPPYGLAASASDDTIIGNPGSVLTRTIRLDSRGVNTDTVSIQVDGGPWPVDLTLPGGGHTQTSADLVLRGCQSVLITATLTIPAGLPRDSISSHHIDFNSHSDPAITTSISLTAKTPADLLLVDGERWYNNLESYRSTLSRLGISYDVFNHFNNSNLPTTSTLESYPMVLWITGYDWFRPMDPQAESRLGAYLDGGGRLLLSSQDLLDVSGIDSFVRTRLGVADATLEVTPTEMIAVSSSPLGSDLGPWNLDYPFNNWSDGLIPAPEARAALQDTNLYVSGVARAAPDWRTAFFSFPLETLDPAARDTLIGRTLLWLSPLGESRLAAPPAASEGSVIPITLTLGLADSHPRSGLKASLPLLPETSLVPGSLQGSWSLDAGTNSLVWEGALSPGERIELRAQLQLASGILDGQVLPLQAHLFTEDGLPILAEAPVQVDVPWFGLSAQVDPIETAPGSTVHYTLRVDNSGPVSGGAALTVSLPEGLVLAPGSVEASLGTASSGDQAVLWNGTLPPGGEAIITFEARTSLPRPGAKLITRAELVDGSARRFAYAVLTVPMRVYFPMFMNRIWEASCCLPYLGAIP